MFEESNKDKIMEVIKKMAVTALVLFYLFFVMDKFDNIFNFKSTLFSLADQRPAQNIDNQKSSEDENEDESGEEQNQQEQEQGNQEGDQGSEGATEDETETQQPPSQPAEKIVVEIAPGMPLVSIASKLHDMGLIENEFEFLKEVDQMRAETKLQAGTFRIPFGADYQQIIKILIGQI